MQGEEKVLLGLPAAVIKDEEIESKDEGIESEDRSSDPPLISSRQRTEGKEARGVQEEEEGGEEEGGEEGEEGDEEDEEDEEDEDEEDEDDFSLVTDESP